MKEKRIGPDTVMNMISGISVVSWITLGVIFLIIAVANPTSSALSVSRPGLKGAGQWTTTVIYVLLIFLLLLSVSGVLFNVTRLKRKSDKLRISIIISGVFSVIGLVIMSIK